MNNISEYYICCGESIFELQGSINGLIKEGWQPFESLSVSVDPNDAQEYFYQPMVKKIQN